MTRTSNEKQRHASLWLVGIWGSYLAGTIIWIGIALLSRDLSPALITAIAGGIVYTAIAVVWGIKYGMQIASKGEE